MSFGNLPTNIYELLGEEGESSKPTKTAVKSAPATQTQTQNRSQKPADNRQGQRTQGGNRADERTSSDNAEGDRKKVARGGKNPADGRKPKGVDAPRLDRRSGTGRGKEIKKGGAGKGNWGNPESEENPTAPVEAEPVVHHEPVVETEEERTKREEEEKKKEEERQKEERQMTLDEYLQKKKSVGLELPAPRKPGEGATDAEKKAWASQEIQKDKQAVAVPEKKAETVVSQEKAVVIESATKLSVLEDLGINVRIRDDARSRRKAQRYEEEKRRQNDEKFAKPATEDPKLKQKKKKGPYRPPQKTEENFPALSTKA